MKKLLITFSIFALITQSGFSQSRAVPYDSVAIKPLSEMSCERARNTLELQSNWIRNNIRYPIIAQENNIYGIVYIRYIIEIDGSINEIEVISYADPLLSREVLRVIRQAPLMTHVWEYNARILLTTKVHFQLYMGDGTIYAEKTTDKADINIEVLGFGVVRRTRTPTFNVFVKEEVRPTFWQRITRIFRR